MSAEPDLLDEIIRHPPRHDPPVDVQQQVLRRIAQREPATTNARAWLALAVALVAVGCMVAEPVLGRWVHERTPGLLATALAWGTETGLVLLAAAAGLFIIHHRHRTHRRESP